MREIEFRGKRMGKPGYRFYPGDKIWVCGYVTAVKKTIITTNEYPNFKYEVDPETAGQYTGLKDRNGVKIFEGDIIIFPEFPENGKFAVIFYDGSFYAAGLGSYGKKDISEVPKFTSHWWRDGGNGVPVITGSIHDNPELLNEKEEKSNDTKRS